MFLKRALYFTHGMKSFYVIFLYINLVLNLDFKFMIKSGRKETVK